MSATLRLFAALDPPEEVSRELARWARDALRGSRERSGRVLAPESMHVTLLFLGEQPFDAVGDLAEAIERGAEGSPPCLLETGAPAWLPRGRPRALAVEVHDLDGVLAPLQHSVAAALCETAGLPAPKRFRAHLTVARIRSAGGRGSPTGGLVATPALRFTAAEVVLYRSHLEPQGARYERVAAVPLTG